MADFPIGVMDSGKGGLSVLAECKKLLPNEKFIYIDDKKNAPFGTKTIDELKIIASNMVDKLVEKGAKFIVLACGTISTNILDYLTDKYPNVHFIGTFPGFEQIFEPGLELSHSEIRLKNSKINLNIKRKKMLIIATNSTCKSKYLLSKVKSYKKFIDIYVEPAQEIVDFVENNKIESFELKKYLDNLFANYHDIDYLVLGCTHFPFVKKQIVEILGDKIKIVSGCEKAAKDLYIGLAAYTK